VKLGPADPPERTEETIDRARQHLFRQWLRERREAADVEWYWGHHSVNDGDAR
jgi:hypothetical protein